MRALVREWPSSVSHRRSLQTEVTMPVWQTGLTPYRLWQVAFDPEALSSIGTRPSCHSVSIDSGAAVDVLTMRVAHVIMMSGPTL